MQSAADILVLISKALHPSREGPWLGGYLVTCFGICLNKMQ